MKSKFRNALYHGEGYTFNYAGCRHEVLSPCVIWNIDRDETYVLYIDF